MIMADELKTANQLWHDYKTTRDKNPQEWEKKDATDKIVHFQGRGYNDFITKYAIPTRYMLEYGEYSPCVFEKYLQRLKTVAYKSKDEWIERQADYVKMLWRKFNPHGNTKEAQAQWQYARDSIKQEMEGFESDYEKAKATSEDRHQIVLAAHRSTLQNLLEMDPKTRERLMNMSDAAPPASERRTAVVEKKKKRIKKSAQKKMPPVVEECDYDPNVFSDSSS